MTIEERIATGEAAINAKIDKIAAEEEKKRIAIEDAWFAALDEAKDLLPDDVAEFLCLPREYEQAKPSLRDRSFTLEIDRLAPIRVEMVNNGQGWNLRNNPFRVGSYYASTNYRTNDPYRVMVGYGHGISDLDEALALAKREYDDSYQDAVDEAKRLNKQEEEWNQKTTQAPRQTDNDRIAKAAKNLIRLIDDSLNQEVPF